MYEMEKTRSDKMEVEIEINEKDFQEKVIEQSNKIPVVVDFWSPICMPCLMLGPVLEKLAKLYDGKFLLAKINLSQNRAIAQTYRIMSIPAVKFFKHGKVTDEFIGALGESAVKGWLDKNLKVEK